MSSTDATETTQSDNWTFGTEELITTLIAIVTIGFMTWGHLESMDNIKKTNQMLHKYEQQLDLMIAKDPEVLKTYQTNLNNALDSLSQEERKLLQQVFEVSTTNKEG